MIASRDGEAVAVHRARNAANSALRYAMDPMEQYKLQTAIEDAGLDLGAIYHSHTRSDPDPVGDRHQPRQARRHRRARVPGHAVPDRRRQGPRGRPAPVVDRRQQRRAGRAPGDGVTGALVCPSCAARARGPRALLRGLRAAARPRRRGSEEPPKSELAIRARKVRPGYAEGPLVRAAWARNQAEAELDPGAAAGGGHPVARAPLGRLRRARLPRRRPARHPRRRPPASTPRARSSATAQTPRGCPPQRHPPWVRALAMTLAMVVFAVVRGRRRGAVLRLDCDSRAVGASARRSSVCRIERGNAISSARSGPSGCGPRASVTHGAVALLAREQVEDRAAEQQRVGARRRERRRRPLAQPARDRRADVARLPGEPLRGALDEPRPARPAGEPRRARPAAAAPGGRRRRSGARAARSGRASASPASPRRSRRGARAAAGRGRAARAGRPSRRRSAAPRARSAGARAAATAGRRRAGRSRSAGRPRAPRAASRSAPPAACGRTRAARARAPRPPRRARRGAPRTCRRRVDPGHAALTLAVSAEGGWGISFACW